MNSISINLTKTKHTQEEEHYANALIEEFEKGTIIDCENGCTLRSYLSRKLNCAPMRISKKYAGKSIGKHVFLSRMSSLANQHGLCSTNNVLGLNNNDINKIPPATQANLQKLRDLEFRFHMSLLQEGTPCGLRQSLGNEQKGHLNKITGSYKSDNKTLPVIYPSPSINNVSSSLVSLSFLFIFQLSLSYGISHYIDFSSPARW